MIFAYKIARLTGCLALLGFSLATLILEETGQIEDYMFGIFGKWGKKHRKHKNKKHAGFTEAEWLQVALCITAVRFIYVEQSSSC